MTTVFMGSSVGSVDEQDPTLTYSWDWDGDSVIDATGATSTHVYSADGEYEVTLTAEDSGGLRSFMTP